MIAKLSSFFYINFTKIPCIKLHLWIEIFKRHFLKKHLMESKITAQKMKFLINDILNGKFHFCVVY